MSIEYVLYNNKAATRRGIEDVELVKEVLNYGPQFIDIQNISDYRVFLSVLEDEDVIVIAG